MKHQILKTEENTEDLLTLRKGTLSTGH